MRINCIGLTCSQLGTIATLLHHYVNTSTQLHIHTLTIPFLAAMDSLPDSNLDVTNNINKLAVAPVRCPFCLTTRPAYQLRLPDVAYKELLSVKHQNRELCYFCYFLLKMWKVSGNLRKHRSGDDKNVERLLVLTRKVFHREPDRLC